jgi:carbonic anhydrase
MTGIGPIVNEETLMRRTLGLAVSFLVALSVAGQAPVPKTPSADELWTAMLRGNEQFVSGKLTYDALKIEREAVQREQLPPITVLSCADSRIPPELAFNQSVGGLFVVRAAGNIADQFGVASIEYAIAQGWTRLLVVLGHENCGAVAAALAVNDPPTPALQALVRRIRTSFVGIGYDAADPANLKRATDANTRSSGASLLAESLVIRQAVTTGRVKLVTAYYELATGAVKKID